MKFNKWRKPVGRSDSRIRVAVCGHYARGGIASDGQTVKTQTVFNALVDLYGKESVRLCDTYEWKRNPLRLLIECIRISRSSSDIIILPARNGVRIFLPLFYALSKIFGNRLHYSVIGGWLSEVLANHKNLAVYLRAFKTVQVETKKMKDELADFKLSNIQIIPNFKAIQSVSKREYHMSKTFTAPYPLCTFSRVIAEKGIDDAIEAVSRVNSLFGKTVYTLDIYGSVGGEYEEHFNEIKLNFPEYIRYRGVIESNKTVDVLSDYYLLLFPTHFYTEGLPGSIIDAYAAGLPVVSSRWNSFSDIVTEGVTGYGIDIGDIYSLTELLCSLLDTSKVLPLKENCILAFEPFSYESGRERIARCLETEHS